MFESRKRHHVCCFRTAERRLFQTITAAYAAILPGGLAIVFLQCCWFAQWNAKHASEKCDFPRSTEGELLSSAHSSVTLGCDFPEWRFGHSLTMRPFVQIAAK